jgi:RNA polymerase sigma factor (sigma-70 family)
MSQVTELLAAFEQNQPHAAESLLPLVYDELRKLARAKLRQEQPGQTLEATALVHEAYLRLVGPSGPAELDTDSNQGASSCPSGKSHFDHRGHFFAAAAEAMRRILVESARRKQRTKRGGDLKRLPLDEDRIVAPQIDAEIVELDTALDQLAAKDPRKAELVKLRYFAGLTNEQAAQALGVSTATAERDWTYARAWLFRQISGQNPDFS